MWLTGGLLAAAESTPLGGGGSDALIAMIGGVIVAAIGGLVTLGVAIINRNSDRTSPSPPPADPSATTADVRVLREAIAGLADDVVFLRERTAVHGQRLDDSDERDEMQDRRLEAIERHKDLEFPGWRRHE